MRITETRYDLLHFAYSKHNYNLMTLSLTFNVVENNAAFVSITYRKKNRKMEGRRGEDLYRRKISQTSVQPISSYFHRCRCIYSIFWCIYSIFTPSSGSRLQDQEMRMEKDSFRLMNRKLRWKCFHSCPHIFHSGYMVNNMSYGISW